MSLSFDEKLSNRDHTAFQQDWTLQLNKRIAWLFTILMTFIMLLPAYLYFEFPHHRDFRFVIIVVLWPGMLYFFMFSVYLLNSPLMKENYLVLGQDGLSSPYFRLRWGQMENVQLYWRHSHPYLLVTLHGPQGAEYVSKVPFMLRGVLYKLRSNKDPKVLLVSLMMTKGKPEFIFEQAETFFKVFR